ncbi:hypothetical protein BT63DRAFT_369059 [Microthyrium microscopicum]|uniref:Zn(2)-C6 fungal-type domain-containing protein n=1 Tax=Microthyrium microscopicum TaxID=703497 RepID=A0A6A6ULW5_9PEZI|nr:hypothetical protein BT63DRAFT_369059 [Microthyrium microscopicum]
MDPPSNAVSSPDSLGYSAFPGTLKTATKPRRPCDACRKRKSRCEIPEGETICVLCRFHNQICLFKENPQPRKRRKVSEPSPGESSSANVARNGSLSNATPLDPSADGTAPMAFGERRTPTAYIRQETPIDNYANLKGPSLLKKTLGLQSHRHSKILGSTSEFEPSLLSLPAFGTKEEISIGPVSLRKVTAIDCFQLMSDTSTVSYADEIRDLDTIESIVAPHGRELIRLYFRIVHPTYPILHKKVYLEKYERTHREFSPPLLAAVYLLAVNWWSYSSDLALLPKPDIETLESIALRTMSYVVSRPKLSTIQAGLLLLQRPEGESWALTGKLVALGQDLGLHLDCTKWRIPAWEKGLRKRLAWGLFMQDKWGALVHGRPSHITYDDWLVKHVNETDFPERAADEDEEEGSTEVEKGRVLFSEMIKLTEILTTVLSQFYTLRADEEFRAREHEGGRWILEKAKPIQLALREWFAQLPESLRMEQVKMRKLNSTGYLYLAYYTTEITLHRRIVRALQHEKDLSLVQICRNAAQARLSSVTEFVKSLRPEHLQSFWYWASKYCFAIVGTFISLLWATSLRQEEADAYKEKLEEYRWTLRLSSKSAEILDRAASMLATSTGVLVKAIPAKSAADDDNEYEGSTPGDAESEDTGGRDWAAEAGLSDVSMQASPTNYTEGHFDMMWQGFNIPPGGSTFQGNEQFTPGTGEDDKYTSFMRGDPSDLERYH